MVCGRYICCYITLDFFWNELDEGNKTANQCMFCGRNLFCKLLLQMKIWHHCLTKLMLRRHCGNKRGFTKVTSLRYHQTWYIFNTLVISLTDWLVSIFICLNLFKTNTLDSVTNWKEIYTKDTLWLLTKLTSECK